MKEEEIVAVAESREKYNNAVVFNPQITVDSVL
jgi:hypothetical protein